MDTEVIFGAGVAIGVAGTYTWNKSEPKIRKAIRAVKWLFDKSSQEDTGNDG